MQNGHRPKEPNYVVLAGGILAAGGGLLALVAFIFWPYLTYGNVNLTGLQMVTVASRIAQAGNDGSAPFLWWWGVPVLAAIALGLGLALVFKRPASDVWEKSDLLQGRFLAAGIILAAALGVAFLVLPESQFAQSGDWNSMVLAHYGPGAGVYVTFVGLVVAGFGGVMALIGLQDEALKEPTQNGNGNQPTQKSASISPSTLPAPTSGGTTPSTSTAPGAAKVKVEAEGGVSVVNIGGKMTVEAPAPGPSANPDNGPKPSPPPPPLRLNAAGRTDVGRQRSKEQNEDACYVQVYEPQRTTGLFIVADGVGGHRDGKGASQLVVDTIRDALTPLLAPVSPRQTDQYYCDRLREAVKRGNAEIVRYASAHPDARDPRPDPASTVTVALVVEGKAYVANVGDSRTYLFHKGTLQPITRDDSKVAQLVEAGQIKPDDVYTHTRRNEIYRALGFRPTVEIDPIIRPLEPGDALLLCSDGLWEMVRDPEMQDIVTKEHDPDKACKRLIEQANEHGGADNITVVVVRCEEAQRGQR
jgi:serine/threonine protein phosphatase PrpC